MARIAGVDLPREKRVEIGLTYIYGIGLTSSKRILKEANVNPDTRVKDLTDDEVKELAQVISDTQMVEGELQITRIALTALPNSLVNSSSAVWIAAECPRPLNSTI